MPCYSPLTAWRGRPEKSGKRSIVFKMDQAAPGLEPFQLKLPCGQCVGCRLERSRQWAMRCMHEASLYDRNCFITMTFDPAHLPRDGSVSVKTFQDFMKRLRKFAAPTKVRFFHCGEYGDKFGRPHYHALIFNYDFADKKYLKSKNGYSLWTSESLDKLWSFGYAIIGEVSFDSAAYVARYVMKKVNGALAAVEDANGLTHYQRVDGKTGEIFDLKPEYTTMSRRPGIGRGWYDRFRSDIYPHDYAVVNGKQVRPPKFYDGLFELDNEAEFIKMKAARVARGTVKVKLWNDRLQKYQMVDDNCDERLAVKELCTQSRVKELTRSLEE